MRNLLVGSSVQRASRSHGAPERGLLSRSRLLAACAIVALLSSACTHVAPYERGALAHPTMASAELDGPAAGHVHAVHEGSTGGGSVAESGCGCN